MIPTLITPPTVFPITLAEAKDQVEYLQDDKNTFLEGAIRDAVDFVEGELSISIAEQQWRLTLDRFSDDIELLNGPVKSVDAVEYIDADGLTQSVDPAIYYVDIVRRRQFIVRHREASWPTPLNAINAVSITYTAGMDYLPGRLRRAILLEIQRQFDRMAEPKIDEALERAIKSQISKYRVMLA